MNQNKPNWAERIIALFGKQFFDETAPGKHARAKRKPKNWRKHRKIRQKMAKASRKRNRHK